MNYEVNNIGNKKRSIILIKNIKNVNFKYKGEVKIDSKTENEILDYWNELKQKTSFLHESNILIVSNMTCNDDNYNIELKKTTFSYFMYSKKKQLGLTCMFSGAYIVTSDNYMVCVLNNYYSDGENFQILNLIGGMSDACDIIDCQYSSENCLKREFKEELGFNLDKSCFEINLKYIKCPSEDENSFAYEIGMIYEIRTLYTKDELLELFKNSNHDEEITDLAFFSKENYKTVYDIVHVKPLIPELIEKYWSLHS